MIYIFFDRAKTANIYEIKGDKIAEITFIKVVIGIYTDDIGNLEDLLKLVFIDKKCGHLKVVIDDGELTRNINPKKDVRHFPSLYIDLQFLTNAVDASISSISK